jgi:hypothetical protein
VSCFQQEAVEDHIFQQIKVAYLSKIIKKYLVFSEIFPVPVQISADQLVDEIYFARYGTRLDRNTVIGRNPLFLELSAFSKGLKGQRRLVTVPGVRTWFKPKGEGSLPGTKGKTFLRDYLQVLLGGPNVSDVSNPDRLGEIQRFLTGNLPSGTPDTLAELAPLDAIVATRMQYLFETSRINSRSIANDLFWDGDPADERDFSYFLVYRHSSNHGSILKSFLVLQKPDPEIFNDYGFNHFIWGGKPFNDHIFRECEGAILKLEKSYYLLGYNFSVPANKRENPKNYQMHRESSKRKPNGMGLMAFEYSDVEANPGFFGGVTMTLAASHQPVLARVALLHLGTRSGFEKEISDSDVQPTELFTRDLAKDITETIARLKQLKCKKFGMHLQKCLQAPRWAKDGASSLAHDIRAMVDNTPAWEIQRAKPKDKPVSRGAIETFGEKRPRD